jgi:sensor histidine kinase YesM
MKEKKGYKKNDLFNDKWIMIIGSLITGIGFPLIFGMRYGEPEFFKWITISVLVTLVSWEISRRFGNYIWKRFPWNRNPLVHILIVLAYIIVFTLVIILMVYLINLIFEGKTENYWERHRFFHLLILLVFIFSVIVHELIYLFFLWKKELLHSSELEKENMKSKYEALKNHLNPHFLFNSLGTLSSLINTDQEKATQYVNEFSKIYRYFLEVNNNDLVTIKEEIDFINSYIFLQQIRYGNSFSFVNNIDRGIYNYYILPLTLQLLIENALKHNIFNADNPLTIEIKEDKKRDVLVLQNNYQPRNLGDTTKTGLLNLEQRYLNLVGKSISHSLTDKYFTVEIPIICNEL